MTRSARAQRRAAPAVAQVGPVEKVAARQASLVVEHDVGDSEAAGKVPHPILMPLADARDVVLGHETRIHGRFDQDDAQTGAP